jgi:hypothetical protein
MLNNLDINIVVNNALSESSNRQIIYAHQLKYRQPPKFKLSTNFKFLRAHNNKLRRTNYLDLAQKDVNRLNYTNGYFLISAYKPAGLEHLENGLYDYKLNKLPSQPFKSYPDIPNWLSSYVLRLDNTHLNYDVINNQYFLSALNTLKSYKFESLVSVNIGGCHYDLKNFIGVSNLVLNRPGVDVSLRILHNKFLLLFNYSNGLIYDATALMPLLVAEDLENNLQVNFSSYLLNSPEFIDQYPLVG